MIITSMKSTYLLGVLFAFWMLVVVRCWISDDEETTSNEPAYVTATIQQREPTPSSQVAHPGKTTAASEVIPPDWVERSFSYPRPEKEVPAPVELRTFEASAIVRACLMSSSAGAVRYSAAYGIDVDVDKLTSEDGLIPIDGEYRAAHRFRFRVSEYP